MKLSPLSWYITNFCKISLKETQEKQVHACISMAHWSYWHIHLAHKPILERKMFKKEFLHYGQLASCKCAMLAAKIWILCFAVVFCYFQACYLTKLGWGSNILAYSRFSWIQKMCILPIYVCSTNNAKDCKYVW